MSLSVSSFTISAGRLQLEWQILEVGVPMAGESSPNLLALSAAEENLHDIPTFTTLERSASQLLSAPFSVCLFILQCVCRYVSHSVLFQRKRLP